MQLIKLSANKETFHTVTFNEKGISLIIGKRSNPESTSRRETYNGVGKSLLLQLVHFCLGSNSIDELKNKIPDWEFTLEFKVGNDTYISKRNTSDQGKIFLNGDEISIDDFRDYFRERLFKLYEPISYLTFRTLLPRFMRPKKDSYLEFDSVSSVETPYQKLINNAYLLGLDIDKVVIKYELKKELNRIKNLKDNIEKDEIFNKFFTQDRDIDIETFDLEEKITGIERALNKFKVAEDYFKIQQDANDLENKLQTIKNKIVLKQNHLEFINKSLERKADIPTETVVGLYKEMRVDLSGQLVKKLEEVERFHKELAITREKRLQKEKEKLRAQIKELDDNRRLLGTDLDSKIKFLGDHGALEEFVGLNNQLSEYKTELEKLTTYKKVLQEYRNKTEEVKIKLSQENINTNKYMDENKKLLEANMDLYRSLSKEFYKDKPGGIEVTNNENINQIRYDIKVKIEDDASDGINEVKIFCYDFTLLLARHNHNMKCVFHDSRLFSNMDPRQQAVLFKLAHEKTNSSNMQYIVTVNEDVLNNVKEIYSEDEYKDIIAENKVLELTDASSESKLLGIQVDMEYGE